MDAPPDPRADTVHPGGRFVFHAFAVLAEFVVVGSRLLQRSVPGFLRAEEGVAASTAKPSGVKAAELLQLAGHRLCREPAVAGDLIVRQESTGMTQDPGTARCRYRPLRWTTDST